LIGKIAAVYVQRFDDEVALEAVNEVEMLTASLCERIWQKILFLATFEKQLAETATTLPSIVPLAVTERVKGHDQTNIGS
jgi:hypothetical protein